MKLSGLLNYDNITIQCHDNPDADAVAAGFGLYKYFQAHSKNVKLIYSGQNKIQKSNMIMMLDCLQIPIEYVPDNTNHLNGLLITVDCQYGAANVTKFIADDYAIIDHHQIQISDQKKSHIIPGIGSCATIVWQMLNEENFDISNDTSLQTALYYGLYTDTSQFTDISNPVDKDMRDDLVIDNTIIKRLQNSNINAKELEIAGVAIIRSVINAELRFAIVRSQPCDPNILGLISDFVLQVSEIDKCIVYCEFDNGIKFSVRSCVKEDKANHIAAYVSKDIGSGGGHVGKAGGFIDIIKYNTSYGDFDLNSYFSIKLKEYLESYEVIDCETYQYDANSAKVYEKKRVKVGYIKATDILPCGTTALIRTLEGDIHLEITNNLYIMIGVKGEVYPISASQFEKNYKIIENEKYDMQLEYHPKAKISDHSDDYSLIDYAKVCYSDSGNLIYAKQLKKAVKVFTKWDHCCYTIGEKGDYLAVKCNDLHDVYVIEEETFHMTYKVVDSNE